MRLTPPQWMHLFIDEVCRCQRQLSGTSLGCHYHKEGDVWEVTLFCAATEVVGGPHDGERMHPTFWTDLKQLTGLLDVEEMYWQANALDEQDQLGTHLSIIGRYNDHPIWLRILAASPGGLPPGQHVAPNFGTVTENW
ncbi:MAG: hypothetical protein KDA90_03280 [Planctomycetaceae bacterium]|nr:hypothetical protein [Planctomycetaceae bacterium]